MTAGGVTLKKGDIITIDGAAGQVMQGAVPMVKPELTGDFATLMGWADEVRRMKVRANAETPTDARVARVLGAEGIGLCRTEHMFFEGERIVAMREMILAETEQGRRAALAKLLPMQRQDFAELFEIMTGLPVTIRLLDPPLHEFLPKTDEEIDEVSKAMGVAADKLRARSAELHEFNPMLGFRGVRLAVRYPEIAEMQARAIFEGAVEAGKKTGAPVTAEIMVPVMIGKPEFDFVKAIIVAMAEAVAKETGVTVPYTVGTMIELPRAALRAGEIAESAEFFSFGTNDLTQTTLGISRDDAASFLGTYTAKGLLPADPFVTLDTEGVGELIKIAVERGRQGRPDLKLGICGEHGGDPASIAFCEAGASRLRLVLALPHPDRPPRGGAGGARKKGAFDGVRPPRPRSGRGTGAIGRPKGRPSFQTGYGPRVRARSALLTRLARSEGARRAPAAGRRRSGAETPAASNSRRSHRLLRPHRQLIGHLAERLVQRRRRGVGVVAGRRGLGAEGARADDLAVRVEDLRGDGDMRRPLRRERHVERTDVEEDLRLGGKAVGRFGDVAEAGRVQALGDLGLHELRQAVAPLALLERLQAIGPRRDENPLRVEHDQRRRFVDRDLRGHRLLRRRELRNREVEGFRRRLRRGAAEHLVEACEDRVDPPGIAGERLGKRVDIADEVVHAGGIVAEQRVELVQNLPGRLAEARAGRGVGDEKRRLPAGGRLQGRLRRAPSQCHGRRPR